MTTICRKPKPQAVYCKDCAFKRTNSKQDRDCTHPKFISKRADWFEEVVTYANCSVRNENNDCPKFLEQ